MIPFLITLLILSIAIHFLEAIACFLAGVYQFVKNNWYLFILIAWFFRVNMRIEGFLEDHPVTIYFDSDGKEYFDISIVMGLVVFEWEQLIPVHQEQIKEQIDKNWVQPI